MRENITKIPFEFFVCGYFARCLDNEKRSRKNMRGKKRCQDWRENRPDSNTEPLRSLVQFVISRDILRHSPRDYYHFLVFPRANVSIFSLSWRNTLDRRKDVRKYGNRAEKRARLPRIVLIRPRLRQFPTEFSNRFEFPCEFSPREKFLPIFTEKNMGPRKASPKR